jgi:hypothetical protein
MTTARTHFPFRIDVWTTNGESIVEKVVGRDPCPTARYPVQGVPRAP